MSRRQWLLVLSPLLIFGALIGWTAMVSPYSKYGDNWAIDPAIFSFPLFVISNIILAIGWVKKAFGRGNMAMEIFSVLAGISYVVVSGAIFLWPWLYCLSSISKDSL